MSFVHGSERILHQVNPRSADNVRSWNFRLKLAFFKRSRRQRSMKGRLALTEETESEVIHHAGVARSMVYISKHWRKPIKVADLVRVARMSRRGFLKAFSKHTGGTPGSRLRAIRLEHARRQLLGSDERLGKIARACGYRSVNSFIIAFKRDIGIAPIRYREINR
jgi:transcriptional regulator GlxA family with amidase domain